MENNILSAFVLDIDDSEKVELMLNQINIVDVLTVEQVNMIFGRIQADEANRLTKLRKPKLSRIAEMYLGDLVDIECQVEAISYAADAASLSVLKFLREFGEYIAYANATESINLLIEEIENSTVILN